MTGAPEMRKSPEPRANADRADNNRNDATFTITGPAPEENFAAIFIARRYRLSRSLAQAVAALCGLGGAIG